MKHLFYRLCHLGLFFLLFPSSAYSQIVPDGTVGTVLTPGALINGDRVDGGATRGRNLFHSFQEFNINTGRSIYFTNPTDVTNIFTRVTGTNPSNINGTLGVLGSANLVFMNPNGIVFSPGASLDVKGSFLGTTASSINFADGSVFSTTTNSPQAAPLLSVSVPVGLGFGSNSGSIKVQGSGHRGTDGTNGFFIPVYPNVVNPQLKLSSGKTLGLISSGITLDGATLSIADGQVFMGSVAGQQIVPLRLVGEEGFTFDYSGIQNFQDIHLNRTAVDVSGKNGGGINIQGRRVSLTEGSELLAHTLGTNGVGQGMVIRASESLELLSTKGLGAISSIMASVQPNASGKGGAITIETPNFTMAYGALFRAELYGRGQSGDVNFRTQNFQMLGTDISGNPEDNGTDFSIGLSGSSASGKGGTLTIESDRVWIANGARLRSDMWGGASGQLGDINIRSKDVEVTGIFNQKPNFFNSWISSTVERNTNGQAGNITIDANNIRLTDSGTIRADIIGFGTGGNVTLRSPDIEISGFNQTVGRMSRVSARVGSNSPNAIGNGGRIFIDTQRLRLKDGGQVAVGNFTRGAAGSLTVKSGELVEITGAYLPKTGRPSSSSLQAIIEQNATATGGTINVVTPQLRVIDGGEITTAVFGSGNAGNISIQAGSIELSGQTTNGLAPSRITAEINPARTDITGTAGSINIQAEKLTVKDSALISVSSQKLGEAGNLQIRAGTLRLDNGGSLRANASSGSEGNITVDADLLLMRRGSEISTNAINNANGGNITLNVAAITMLEDSRITANAPKLQNGNITKGGNININTQGLFQSLDSKITATGNIDGEIKITTPNIKQENALQEQATNFVDTEKVVASSCLNIRNAIQGRFIVSGNGGLPKPPNDNLDLPYQLVPIQAVNALQPETLQKPANTRVWKVGDSIVEAQSLQTINGRFVLANTNQSQNLEQISDLACETNQ